MHAARLNRPVATSIQSSEQDAYARKLLAEAPEAESHDAIPAIHRAWVPNKDPKVMAAYSHAPGETPREVLVQRMRKAYRLFDLHAALKRAGIDHSSAAAVQSNSGALPLHIFDDEVFESRTHAEWAPASGGDPAPARVLRLTGTGVGDFERAVIIGVDPAGNRYHSRFENSDLAPEWVHRLFVCFDAEDPGQYSKRLISAYRGRRNTEAQLMYNLLVDSMPYGDMPQLNVEQINRMLNYALNNKTLKTQMKLMDTSILISEINIEHARTLNRIIFDHIAHPPPPLPAAAGGAAAAAAVADFPPLPLAEDYPVAPRRKVPARGTADIAPHDFPEAFSQFVFASLLTKNEVITAIVKARAECVKVIDKSLFHLHPSKTLPVLEFLQVQFPFALLT